MFPISQNAIRIQFLSVLSGIVFTIGISSCAGPADLLSSAFIPNPRGFVKVSTDRNEQYVVRVNLKNLIPLPQLSATHPAYVVWMVSDEGSTEKIGSLESSTLFFTKIHSATFKLETKLIPAKIYITAEDNPGNSYSNSEIVFSTSTFRE